MWFVPRIKKGVSYKYIPQFLFFNRIRLEMLWLSILFLFKKLNAMNLTDWLASIMHHQALGPYPLAVAETPGSTDNLNGGPPPQLGSVSPWCSGFWRWRTNNASSCTGLEYRQFVRAGPCNNADADRMWILEGTYGMCRQHVTCTLPARGQRLSPLTTDKDSYHLHRQCSRFLFSITYCLWFLLSAWLFVNYICN